MNTQIIVDRITELCKIKKVSVNQMLKETNLNKSLVDNLKRGSIPSVDKMVVVADYFSVSVDYLIGESNEKEPAVNQNNELGENTVVFHRDGKTKIRKFTKEQMDILMATADAMPEKDKDEI